MASDKWWIFLKALLLSWLTSRTNQNSQDPPQTQTLFLSHGHKIAPTLHLCLMAACTWSPVGHDPSSASAFTFLASLCIGPQGLRRWGIKQPRLHQGSWWHGTRAIVCLRAVWLKCVHLPDAPDSLWRGAAQGEEGHANEPLTAGGPN